MSYARVPEAAGVAGGPILALLITPRGGIGKALLMRSSGVIALDSAVLRAVPDLVMVPAQHNGKPLCFWMTMPFPAPLMLKSTDHP